MARKSVIASLPSLPTSGILATWRDADSPSRARVIRPDVWESVSESVREMIADDATDTTAATHYVSVPVTVAAESEEIRRSLAGIIGGSVDVARAREILSAIVADALAEEAGASLSDVSDVVDADTFRRMVAARVAARYADNVTIVARLSESESKSGTVTQSVALMVHAGPWNARGTVASLGLPKSPRVERIGRAILALA